MDDNMEYSFVNNNSKWLAGIISMGDEFRSTVGFLPRQAFEDYAKKGHIFAATEDGYLLGYIMFRYKGHSLIVVHLCVDSKYRMRGIAKSLVNELFDREKPYISQMQLLCRRDYGLSDFWSSCGFVPVGERDGRSINEKTTLTKWIRTNADYPNIFELFEEEYRIKVVLDTNIVIDLCEQSFKETVALLNSEMDNYVIYCITKNVLTEIDSCDDAYVRNHHREYVISYFDIINDYDEMLYVSVLSELLAGKGFPQYSNSWYDLSHIAYAIAGNATAFVTRDQALLNDSFSDKIFRRYGLQILSPGELVKTVDEIATPNAYTPIRLAGLALSYSEMQQSDYANVASSLFMFFDDKCKKAFSSSLRYWMSVPDKYRLQLIKSERTPVCLIVHSIEQSIVTVQHLILNTFKVKPSILNTFIKRIAFNLLYDANKKGATEVRVEISGLSNEIILAFKECYYEEDNGYLVRTILDSQLDLESFLLNPPRQIADRPAVVAFSRSLSRTNDTIIQIEKAYWPLKLLNSAIPCYIVPIKADYAIKLFDEDLSNTNMSLFVNEKIEPALSIENVYFKSVKNSIKEFPARILWYVSDDPRLYGSKMIRACSFLDEVETSNMQSLYKKYRRLGVLDYAELSSITSSDALVSAYRFSYTEILPFPISLSDVRKILGKKVTFQSCVKISEEKFFELYSLSKKDII
ncbi:MAG: GNAT family N-acetyltransferase [Clostridia bacterium]|nr:GNAT family N-acetyltransferase [Clostridia bacterium]